MSKIELIDPRQPLPGQFLEALRYPLRAATLPALATFTLAHSPASLPEAMQAAARQLDSGGMPPR